MRLDGRRESNNVDDRRGMTAGKAAGIGLGGIVMIALITFMSGGKQRMCGRRCSSRWGAPTHRRRWFFIPVGCRQLAVPDLLR